ncbi:MAG: hypothetical protein KF832_22915 [Caldilineaceae bacterium]|nr:hypothetical protein [Caldilineaceae bacterium]
MTVIAPNGEPQANLYNFFDPDLWLARVDGMVWLLRMTYDVVDSLLGGLEGLSVATVKQLLQAIEQKKGDAQALDLDFHLLEAFLQGLLQKEGLPVSAPNPAWAVDFAFEVKQLINLRSLCITYVYFFADMRQLIVDALAAQPPGEPPPLSLIQACSRQLAHDLEILQRAFLQRQPSVDSTGKLVAGVLAKELVITDKLALKTLAPFAHWLAHPNLLTFFSQATHIRRLPFSDQMILIGLSHARISITHNEQMRSGAATSGRKPLPAFELLVIPHEIGHYLYHHALLPDPAAPQPAPTTTRFLDHGARFRSNPYFHWCEELFADLFGCVVAGPLAVLGMQALLAASEPAQLGHADGEHPTAVVRPYLLAEMLRVLGQKAAALAPKTGAPKAARYQFGNAARSLDANWSAILQQFGFELVNVIAGRPAQIKAGQSAARWGEAVDVVAVLAAVQPIIATFTELLLTNANFERWAITDPGRLSAEIPWVQTDQARLHDYTELIVALLGDGLARQTAPQQGLLPLNFWDDKWKSSLQGTTAAEKLQHWLDNWGDKGPHITGGH